MSDLKLIDFLPSFARLRDATLCKLRILQQFYDKEGILPITPTLLSACLPLIFPTVKEAKNFIYQVLGSANKTLATNTHKTNDSNSPNSVENAQNSSYQNQFIQLVIASNKTLAHFEISITSRAKGGGGVPARFISRFDIQESKPRIQRLSRFTVLSIEEIKYFYIDSYRRYLSTFELSSEQKKALEFKQGRNVLVSAVPGSGKTRVLVSTFLRLCQIYSVDRLILLTFSTEAAENLNERLQGFLPSGKKYAMTIHSLAALILRRYGRHGGFSSNFNIIDNDDIPYILRQICTDLQISDTSDIKQVMSQIDRWKSWGHLPDSVRIDSSKDAAFQWYLKVRAIYVGYEAYLRHHRLVDFTGLMLNFYHLLLSSEYVLNVLKNQYSYIFVDEFQDVTYLQFQVLKLLCGKGDVFLYAVGDPDQQIYSFQTSNIKNILKFTDYFPNTDVYTLKENYRSIPLITEAAKKLIRHNSGRKGVDIVSLKRDKDYKSLTPLSGVSMFSSLDFDSELQFVVEQIKYLHDSGVQFSEIAVLSRYRKKVHQRIVDYLSQQGIPTHHSSGVQFAQRKEVKTLLYYLIFIVDIGNDYAFRHIINLPSRGLGQRTQQIIEHYSVQHNVSLWESLVALLPKDSNDFSLSAKESELLPARVHKSAIHFRDGIIRLRKLLYNRKLSTFIDLVIQQFGLYDYTVSLRAKKPVLDRQEILQSVTKIAESYQAKYHDATVHQFLDYFLLTFNVTMRSEAVTVSTIHAYKGREKKIIFLTGWQENAGLSYSGGGVPSFPSRKAIDSGSLAQLEEERRLAYVAVTRAEVAAIITYSRYDIITGTISKPSRFLKEMGGFVKELQAPVQLLSKKLSLSTPFDLSEYLSLSEFAQRFSIDTSQAQRIFQLTLETGYYPFRGIRFTKEYVKYDENHGYRVKRNILPARNDESFQDATFVSSSGLAYLMVKVPIYNDWGDFIEYGYRPVPKCDWLTMRGYHLGMSAKQVREIGQGCTIFLDMQPDGTLKEKYRTLKPFTFEASHSTKVQVRMYVDKNGRVIVDFSGNPSACFRKDNVFGYTLPEAVWVVNNKILPEVAKVFNVEIPPFQVGTGYTRSVLRQKGKSINEGFETRQEAAFGGLSYTTVSRVDFAINYALSSEKDLRHWLVLKSHTRLGKFSYAEQERGFGGKLSGLTFNNKPKSHWAVVAYDKGLQLQDKFKKQLEAKDSYYVQLVDYVNKNSFLRIESREKQRGLTQKGYRYLGNLIGENMDNIVPSTVLYHVRVLELFTKAELVNYDNMLALADMTDSDGKPILTANMMLAYQRWLYQGLSVKTGQNLKPSTASAYVRKIEEATEKLWGVRINTALTPKESGLDELLKTNTVIHEIKLQPAQLPDFYSREDIPVTLGAK